MHHGMLTIYKEKGYTSSDAVARLRGILQMRRIGHTGTLDPDAEGVLPMCLGNATRLCELIADKEKEYLAVMRLGVRTDTQDMSGTVLTQITEDEVLRILCSRRNGGRPDDPVRSPADTAETETMLQGGKEAHQEKSAQDAAQQTAWTGTARQGGGKEAHQEKSVQDAHKTAKKRILETAAAFTGQIGQIPPMYSAIKINGKRLYDLARRGETVERKPRRVTIYRLDVEKIELPLVTMRVCCSRGTYIRTLCEDIGNALGTGAAMQSLLRTRVGQFALEQSLTLDEVERIVKTQPEKIPSLIRPVDSFFEDLPAAVCRSDALRLLRNGNALRADQLSILPRGEDPAAGEAPVRDADGLMPGRDRSGPLLPGTEPGDRILRVYDGEGRFYGLYRGKKGQGRYTAFRMFLS